MNRVIALVLFALAVDSISATAAEQLRFFIVTEEQTPGTQPIALPDLTVEGFMREEPDLVLSKLGWVAAMAPGKSTIIDENGKATEGTPHYAVMIALKAADGPLFAELTGKAVGQRILIYLGERPLSAPKVHERVNTPRFQLTLGPDSQEARKIEKALLKLTK